MTLPKNLLVNCLALASLILHPESFKKAQLQYERVRAAYSYYELSMLENCKRHNIPVSELEILVRVFKEEKEMELWIKKQADSVFHRVKSFPVKNNMPLGPKLNEHDGKVPEGFYYINKLHTSVLRLPINFPNVADKIFHNNQGIKGNSAICSENDSLSENILLSKENLEELYVYFVEAKNNGLEYIPIHIFPFRMTEASLEKKLSKHKNDKSLCRFWEMIEPGYTFFEKSGKMPVYTYSRTGYWFHFDE